MLQIVNLISIDSMIDNIDRDNNILFIKSLSSSFLQKQESSSSSEQHFLDSRFHGNDTFLERTHSFLFI